ncbi:precorrin-4 C(11)-methyltransferase [Desulfurivibrio dismutans]|uniref:precorrin-4 C(11)-methyltransferase n=1 Tax=Desulfurivibrio dismutans TaxID=1398908 RepID=UPI0023DBB21C|nr:precorrin-4 C(11)-methyltransferase [Desulfurivibrio alkaliphilus]MDF1613350.1 precorrin-4 C(11)-methyltransferase [Desulfurivibrio alkaliphilus]
MNNSANIIHFVGAGPGDPELITVKGQRLLAEAELIVYTGSLVPETLLAGLTAEIHNSAGLTLDEVIELLAAGWRRGQRVVRLHTGDPAIYGAIGEQMARLGELGIPWRVVPGVSSVTAAAAALSAELTLPEVSQSVIITRRGGRTPVPEREQLPALAACQATMTILLSAGMMDEVTADLLIGGYPADTPAAVVANASQPEELIVRGTLADIAGKAREAGISKTAIIVVGKVLTAGAPPALSKLYDPDFSHGYR